MRASFNYSVGRVGLAVVLVGALAACGDFNVTDPNNAQLDDFINNPNKQKAASVATGIFSGARTGIEGYIWRLGSMGREGANLAGNNQPDYIEPFFGPVAPGGSFGGTQWLDRYANIRTINTYLDAVPRAPDLSASELAASIGMGKTMKALAFWYLIQTRGTYGAPVDVDRPVTAAPAPFVTEDSVYGYIIGLLDEARDSLNSAGTTAFPFPVPSGLGQFNTPSTFVQFNRALAAKAWIFRGTVTAACGATCFNNGLTELNSAFLSTVPADFAKGAYFNFSNSAGDIVNALSEPLDATTYFALDYNATDAQAQAGGAPDQRFQDKVSFIDPTDSTVSYQLSGFPNSVNRKFVNFFSGGAANENAPIPIIKDEELILLRAEANIALGNYATAITDLDLVRVNSGNLPPTTLTPASPAAAFVDELLYNRRYSLLWEQGTRWIDARRYGRLNQIPAFVPNGQVPSRMPIPNTECTPRGLGQGCDPLGT